MRELALHILDILENATRAGASLIYVAVFADDDADLLEISIEDNGPGMPATPEEVLDPFFTSKPGKRTGLGLSLFSAAAEQAGGNLSVASSDLGGAAVRTSFGLHHVDRAPLGDVAGTLFSAVLTHPEIEFCFHLRTDTCEHLITTSSVLATMTDATPGALARAFAEQVRAALAEAAL